MFWDVALFFFHYKVNNTKAHFENLTSGILAFKIERLYEELEWKYNDVAHNRMLRERKAPPYFNH